MVAATFDRAPVADAAALTKTAQRTRWYARLIDALIAARMEQARREIARHSHYVPYVLDARTNRIVKAGTGDMLSGGW